MQTEKLYTVESLKEFASVIRGEHKDWRGDKRANAEQFLLNIRRSTPLAACTFGHDIEENIQAFSDETGLPFRTLHQAANVLCNRVNSL